MEALKALNYEQDRKQPSTLITIPNSNLSKNSISVLTTQSLLTRSIKPFSPGGKKLEAALLSGKIPYRLLGQPKTGILNQGERQRPEAVNGNSSPKVHNRFMSDLINSAPPQHK